MAVTTVSVESQIGLSQLAWCNLHRITLESLLGLSQDATAPKTTHPIAETQVELDQWAWCHFRRVTAENRLIETEEVYDPITVSYVTVSSGLDQSAEVRAQQGKEHTTYLQTVHRADAVHVKASGVSVWASSQLNLNQTGQPTLTGDAASQLSLVQSASVQAGRPVGSHLQLGQSASSATTRAKPTESGLAIHQTAAYTLILASTEHQYSPFVGSSDAPGAPEPPSLSLQGPMVGIQVPFQLVYPATGVVTDSVSLKAPNLGNKDRLAFNRVMRQTRGGTLIVFADPIWPKTETLVLSFSGLLRVEAHNLLTFIQTHIGQEIGLIDWEHRYWRGVITTPDEPIVEDRFDSFSAGFEFEGELDPIWNPQVVPPALRYSATRSPQHAGYYVPNEPLLPVMPEIIDYHTAQADWPIKIGQPVYLTGVGHAGPAQASAAATTQVVGVSISDVAAHHACRYLTEGRVERTDWMEVAGTALLSVGATYFLDPLMDGRITTMAPTAQGHYVVRVGRAVSSNVLDVEIELPILL